MRISNSDSHQLRIYQGQIDQARQPEPQVDTAKQQASARRAEARDTVEISQSAQMLERASRAAETGQVTPPERLEELQKQVQNDTYQVPLAQLTARLLSGSIFS
jgi:anti-sigma28 factor (negative regulator of flagellin synthesis)